MNGQTVSDLTDRNSIYRNLIIDILAIVMENTKPHLAGHPFCLVGTAAAVMHGVPVPMGDIDFLMKDRQGVDAFAKGMASFRCLHPPALLAGAAQYYAAVEINGLKVEASTVEVPTVCECIEVSGEGPWKHYSVFDCGGFKIPVIALELRLATEIMRDRADRIAPLIDWMKTHGYDLDLLAQALTDRDVPAGKQQHVLNNIIHH